MGSVESIKLVAVFLRQRNSVNLKQESCKECFKDQ